MSKPAFKLSQPSSTNTGHRRLIALVVIALLVAGIGGYLYWQKQQSNKEAAQQQAQDEAQIDTAKTEEISDADKEGSSADDTTPVTSGTTTESATATISSVTQANGTVTATGTITGASGQGGCVFRFSTTDSQPVVRSGTSSASGDSQVCTVTIPEVEFSKVGSWNANLTFTIGDKTLEASKSVTIN